jgi:hypothetical protein
MLHIDVFPELLEHECDGKDANEGRQTSTDGADESTFVSHSFIADEDAYIHGKDARTRLRDGNQVEQFVATHPTLFIDNFLFDERYHSISAPNRKEAYLKESLEEFPHLPFNHFLYSLETRRAF